MGRDGPGNERLGFLGLHRAQVDQLHLFKVLEFTFALRDRPVDIGTCAGQLFADFVPPPG